MWPLNQDRLFPELQRFPHAEEASDSLQRARGNRPISLLVLIYFAFVLVGSAAWHFGLKPIIRDGFIREVLIQGSLVALIALGAGYVGFVMWRRPIRKVLRQDLLALGVPICLECGYDVRGLTSSRCPECGSKIGGKENEAPMLD